MYMDLDSNKSKFVIAGVGTAGYITALMLRSFYPNISITLIESQEIGILGAGEGTVPQVIDILDSIGVPVSDLIKYADATIKNGVKLVNWNGRGSIDTFYSSFLDAESVDYIDKTRLYYSLMPMAGVEAIAKGENISELLFSVKASKKNKVRMLKNTKNQPMMDPLKHFYILGPYSVHFNAMKLAKHLKNVALTKNITVIDGIIDKINDDKDGYITSFDLKDGTNIPCDFVFDSTGFSRLILGKHLKTKWISCQENLPVNRAMPFFMPLDPNKGIPPYTEALAMKYGWMWKIPTRERFGCGYVYDSRLVSDEDAKKEVDEITGVNTEVPKMFSFDPGYFEKFWVKNCIATGLASQFFEPLEATAIHIAALSVLVTMVHNRGMTVRDEDSIARYNKIMNDYNIDTVNFLQFHYLGKRTDTVFWKDFRTNNKLTDFIQKLETSNRDVTQLIERGFNESSLYPMGLYIEIGSGIRYWNKERAIEYFNSLNTGLRKKRYAEIKPTIIPDQERLLTSCIDHREFLDYVLANK